MLGFKGLSPLALIAVGIVSNANADVVYQNTTNPTGSGFLFEGAATVGGNLAANIDINDLILAPGSAGEAISSLSFLAFNFNTVAVQARPTMYIWAADGAGGTPGTLLGDFVLPVTTFGAGAQQAISISTGNEPLIPGSMEIWAGIGFDNDNGVSPITASQLDAMGAHTYHPATIGTDGPDAYFLPPGESLNDPAAILFDTNSTANYGWTVQATATPEPQSAILLSTIVLGVAFVFRKRLPGV